MYEILLRNMKRQILFHIFCKGKYFIIRQVYFTSSKARYFIKIINISMVLLFQRNKSLRICEMCFAREIHLRCMKYSLRECGFISFHRKRSFLFHNLRSKLFHINEVDISLKIVVSIVWLT